LRGAKLAIIFDFRNRLCHYFKKRRAILAFSWEKV